MNLKSNSTSQSISSQTSNIESKEIFDIRQQPKLKSISEQSQKLNQIEQRKNSQNKNDFFQQGGKKNQYQENKDLSDIAFKQDDLNKYQQQIQNTEQKLFQLKRSKFNNLQISQLEKLSQKINLILSDSYNTKKSLIETKQNIIVKQDKQFEKKYIDQNILKNKLFEIQQKNQNLQTKNQMLQLAIKKNKLEFPKEIVQNKITEIEQKQQLLNQKVQLVIFEMEQYSQENLNQNQKDLILQKKIMQLFDLKSQVLLINEIDQKKENLWQGYLNKNFELKQKISNKKLLIEKQLKEYEIILQDIFKKFYTIMQKAKFDIIQNGNNQQKESAQNLSQFFILRIKEIIKAQDYLYNYLIYLNELKNQIQQKKKQKKEQIENQNKQQLNQLCNDYYKEIKNIQVSMIDYKQKQNDTTYQKLELLLELQKNNAKLKQKISSYNKMDNGLLNAINHINN